jgi:hypothetical protein
MKKDRRLVHVDDKTPVVIATADIDTHKSQEVKGLTFNFGWRALRRVLAHSICVRMGMHKALHTAAARCEALCVELGRHKLRP